MCLQYVYCTLINSEYDSQISQFFYVSIQTLLSRHPGYSAIQKHIEYKCYNNRMHLYSIQNDIQLYLFSMTQCTFIHELLIKIKKKVQFNKLDLNEDYTINVFLIKLLTTQREYLSFRSLVSGKIDCYLEETMLQNCFGSYTQR